MKTVGIYSLGTRYKKIKFTWKNPAPVDSEPINGKPDLESSPEYRNSDCFWRHNDSLPDWFYSGYEHEVQCPRLDEDIRVGFAWPVPGLDKGWELEILVSEVFANPEQLERERWPFCRNQLEHKRAPSVLGTWWESPASEWASDRNIHRKPDFEWVARTVWIRFAFRQRIQWEPGPDDQSHADGVCCGLHWSRKENILFKDFLTKNKFL